MHLLILGYPTKKDREDLDRSFGEVVREVQRGPSRLANGKVLQIVMIGRVTARRPWLYFAGVPLLGLTGALLLVAA